MDQTKGNIIVSPPRYASGNKPNFTGKISMPGSESEQRVALWKREYADKKTGEMITYFSGVSSEISFADSADDQIASMGSTNSAPVMEEANISLNPHQVVLFKNGNKDYSVESSGEGKPDYWGRWNPGKGEKQVAIGVWARKSKSNGQVFLSGATQYPLTKEEAEQMRMSQAEHDQLETTGDVTTKTPRRSRGRAD